jgi:hypothetical protein
MIHFLSVGVAGVGGGGWNPLCLQLYILLAQFIMKVSLIDFFVVQTCVYVCD